MPRWLYTRAGALSSLQHECDKEQKHCLLWAEEERLDAW